MTTTQKWSTKNQLVGTTDDRRPVLRRKSSSRRCDPRSVRCSLLHLRMVHKEPQVNEEDREVLVAIVVVVISALQLFRKFVDNRRTNENRIDG